MPTLTLLLLFSGGSARAIPTSGLPSEAIEAIGRLEQGVRGEREGRKILAESAHVPRLAGKNLGLVVDFQREPAALVFDLEKLSRAQAWEFELELIRAASLAAQGMTFPLIESEVKARADELAFALEKARDDEAFAAAFRAARRAGEAERAGILPRGEIELLGVEADRLAVSTGSFARAAGNEEAFDPETVGFAALADFVERHGPNYLDVTWLEKERFARAGGKLYPGALYRAALSLREAGGLAPVREALGPLETQTLPELRRRLEKFK